MHTVDSMAISFIWTGCWRVRWRAKRAVPARAGSRRAVIGLERGFRAIFCSVGSHARDRASTLRDQRAAIGPGPVAQGGCGAVGFFQRVTDGYDRGNEGATAHAHGAQRQRSRVCSRSIRPALGCRSARLRAAGTTILVWFDVCRAGDGRADAVGVGRYGMFIRAFTGRPVDEVCGQWCFDAFFGPALAHLLWPKTRTRRRRINRATRLTPEPRELSPTAYTRSCWRNTRLRWDVAHTNWLYEAQAGPGRGGR